MKKVILSMAMALMVSVAFGQTVSQLIEKYKAVPGSEYEEKTRDSLLAEMLTDEELMAQGVGKEESAFIRKNLKRSEQVTLQLDSVQQEALNRDIQLLQGYELLMAVNENNAPDEEANILQQMFSQVLNPQSKVAVYGRVKKNMVDDVLIRWDIWNKVVLGHIDCKIKKESLSKVIQLGDDWSIVERETDDVVDVKDVLKEVEAGNVLFVIHGKEYPDFHSTEEARDYMINNGIHWNIESWVIGTSVKEKYPNTDRKVVIEYSATKVEDGNVLIVIEGKEHPELNSEKEAEEYMKSNGIKWNNKYTMERSMVKKKYPHTDKKYAIEYSLKSNEDILREDAAFDPNVGEWHYVDEEEEYSQTDKKVVIGSEDNGTTFYLPSKTEIMNCVILLNGKYRPEFHNEDEVIKYLSDEDGVLNGEYGVHYYFDQEKASKYDKTKKVVADITFTEYEDEK